MAENLEANKPLPTEDDSSWREFGTVTREGTEYPAPKDWELQAATGRAVLWTRPAEQHEDGDVSPTSVEKDRAVLAIEPCEDPSQVIGEWCALDINHDPILTIEHPDQNIVWDVISELLIRSTTEKPLFDQDALKADAPPFNYAANVSKGDFWGELSD